MYFYGLRRTGEKKDYYRWIPLKTLLYNEPDKSGKYEAIIGYYEPLPKADIIKYGLDILDGQYWWKANGGQ